MLILSRQLAEQIAREGERAYPDECCGIMFGHERDGRRVVARLEPVPNVFDETEKYHRFSIDPKTLMDADRRAGGAGELVLGFYHSHPDHPAQPSEYDRVHAWPFYSYVIIAIEKAQAKVLNSFRLNEQTEQFEPEPVGAE